MSSSGQDVTVIKMCLNFSVVLKSNFCIFFLSQWILISFCHSPATKKTSESHAQDLKFWHLKLSFFFCYEKVKWKFFSLKILFHWKLANICLMTSGKQAVMETILVNDTSCFLREWRRKSENIVHFRGGNGLSERFWWMLSSRIDMNLENVDISMLQQLGTTQRIVIL